MLLNALSIHKRLSVTEAAELLGVPAATVRRDFEELARQQLATRTHGAWSPPPSPTTCPRDIASPPATRVSGSLMPRPSWSGTERSEMVSRGAARHRGGRFTEDRGRRPGEDLHD